MKNSFCILLAFLFFVSAKAQNDNQQKASVEKSIYGIQVGTLGFWGHNESRLSNSIAIRTEVGMVFGFAINSSRSLFLLTPEIIVEPRWYYNLNKRVRKSRSINNNSGNFLALKTSFNPDLFVISNVDNVSVNNQFFIIPKWGIKRSIGNHFTYEAGIGIGYHYTFKDAKYYRKNKEELGADIHLRIGYTF